MPNHLAYCAAQYSGFFLNSFFGIVPPDTAAHWHDTWQDMPYLPSLIRLSLTSADGLAIPEFTVKPRVTAPEPPARGATEASTR